MNVFRWAIFGTGAVSANFVAGLKSAHNHKSVVVASRTKAKAEAFAAGTGVERAVEGYAEAARLGGVDAVYIATPNSEHATHALMCIEAGLPVLIEKPFASSPAEAKLIIEAARRHGVFAMEAMWTRFLPAVRQFHEQVAAGAVGDVRLVSGSFGTSKRFDPKDNSFSVARGGAVAQLGVYPLSLAQSLFGTPTTIEAVGRIGTTGVEEDASIELEHANGVVGSFLCSIRAWAPNEFTVMGTDGMAAFRGPIYRPFGYDLARQGPRGVAPVRFDWKARLREHTLMLRLAQRVGTSTMSRATKSISAPFAGNGYHYQAEEVAACIGRGALESSTMPLSDSISVVETIETIRASIQKRASKGQAS